MFLLSKHDKQKESAKGLMLSKMVAKVEAELRIFAGYLQAKTNRLSTKGRAVIFFAFSILSASLATYQIISSLLKPAGTILIITPVSKPLYSTKTGEEGLRSKTSFSVKDYKKITDFESYLDNLNTSFLGRKARDNIFKNRNHLLDTLKLLETIFIKREKDTLWKRKHTY
jgi:hypothetical protein